VLGSLTRWFLSLLIPQSQWGTLAANLLGVALAIFFLVLMERRGITAWLYFLLPGFCGGMTTFSAVTYQVVGPDKAGFGYLALTIFSSLAVAHLAMVGSRRFIKERQL
jgi:CrcB protein